MNSTVANLLFWHRLLAQIIFGFTPRFLSGFRTRAQQTALFRSPPSTNPVAFPGTSQHEFGFAYDLAPDVFPGSFGYDNKIQQLKRLGEALGMFWGGPGDPQHYQAISRDVWNNLLGFISSSRGVA